MTCATVLTQKCICWTASSCK